MCFASSTQYQVSSDPYAEVQTCFVSHNKIKSILIPQHQNQINFDLYTPTNPVPTPHQKQVNYGPYTEIKSSSTPHINQVSFDPKS